MHGGRISNSMNASIDRNKTIIIPKTDNYISSIMEGMINQRKNRSFCGNEDIVKMGNES